MEEKASEVVSATQDTTTSPLSTTIASQQEPILENVKFSKTKKAKKNKKKSKRKPKSAEKEDDEEGVNSDEEEDDEEEEVDDEEEKEEEEESGKKRKRKARKGQQGSKTGEVVAVVREEQVQNAVNFLNHSGAGGTLTRKLAFLQHKGLTQEEITEALNRSSLITQARQRSSTLPASASTPSVRTITRPITTASPGGVGVGGSTPLGAKKPQLASSSVAPRSVSLEPPLKPYQRHNQLKLTSFPPLPPPPLTPQGVSWRGLVLTAILFTGLGSGLTILAKVHFSFFPFLLSPPYSLFVVGS
jgi:hypothetical protein